LEYMQSNVNCFGTMVSICFFKMATRIGTMQSKPYH
jgi:hypothetical protein